MLGFNLEALMEAEPAADMSDKEPEEAEEAPRRITRSSSQSPKVNASQRHRIVRRHSDSDSNSDSDMKKSASSTWSTKPKPTASTHRKLGSYEQSSLVNSAPDDESDSDVQITAEFPSPRPTQKAKARPRIRSDSQGIHLENNYFDLLWSQYTAYYINVVQIAFLLNVYSIKFWNLTM